MLSEKQADGSTTEEEEIAIKKVLQDKRFKVCLNFRVSHFAYGWDTGGCTWRLAVLRWRLRRAYFNLQLQPHLSVYHAD